ncbi:S8 family serine peptidase [Couchioplanes caeruleus]|uniref:Serine protease AprX n=1 Tax=Couchioplanes caeruleus TaxID=56438 RepID=A0A3N1GPF6_9ACTN|nr:S8 family serine peptidase [Couchioplanes caeruleus]ROP32101.1 serine protease AprX [Couchioplanes caeruleus]
MVSSRGPRRWLVGILSGALGAVAVGAVPASAASAAPAQPVKSNFLTEEWLAEADSHSLYSINKWAGVHDVWSKTDALGRKITGEGVGVALIDSGISPVKGLSGDDKVINGPDLSLESQTDDLRYLDTYGHGTHMAGIIAGRDPEVLDGSEKDSRYFVGVAPGAHLVNMKVAAADGAVDVSQVIAAIDWVVAHRDDPGMNIRVINLSYGTDSLQDPRFDPLSHAVEAAWRKGIVVVVAAGNDGASASRLAMPAMNPNVIAVGGADPNGTDSRTDDVVGDFSSRGSEGRAPDLVAPGKSVVSLRDPGSFIDTEFPEGLLPTDSAQRFFRGSGTSQAAAVTSGAAALLLQQRPDLTPDQVKELLVSTAQAMPAADTVGSGAGQLDVKAAVEAATPQYQQNHEASLGTGSLEQARGTSHLTDPITGVDLTGEQDIMGQPWNPTVWSQAALDGTSWNGGIWNGTAWTGTEFDGTSWASTTWTGTAWSGVDWTAHQAAFTGRSWTGRSWTGGSWTGRSWTGRSWTGGVWAGKNWPTTD